MSVGRSYCFTAPTSGTLTPVIPVPAGCSAVYILSARVACSSVLSGAETFLLQGTLSSTVTIATATMADATAIAEFIKSSTAVDAHRAITNSTIISGALSFVIPEMDSAYTIVLDIVFDDCVPPLS